MINIEYLLKMGWEEYSPFDRKLADEKSKIALAIHINLNSKVTYFFKSIDFIYFLVLVYDKLNTKHYHLNGEPKEVKILKYDRINNLLKSDIIESNISLMSYIRDNLCCKSEYKRFFQINSIIKNKQ